MGTTNNNSGGKAIGIAKFLIAVFLLVALMVWIYGMNQEGVPQ